MPELKTLTADDHSPMLHPVPLLPALETVEESTSLHYYGRILWRQRWPLLTFVLVITVAAMLVAFTLPKQYESIAILRVDPFGSHVVGDTSSGSMSGAGDVSTLVNTEAQVIASPAVVLRTMRNLKLAQNPEFAPYAKGAPGSVEQANQVLRQLTKQISINQPPQTMLVEVHFRSHNPQLSADVANGLASEFLEHEYETRGRALLDSSKSMSQQLDSMRAQMERDENALVEYQSQYDVIDPENTQNIYESSLAQVNDALSKAEAERVRLQADYELVQNGGLDSLLVSQSGASLLPLQARLRDDQRQLAHLSQIYGPRHPLYEEQEQLVSHDQTVLGDAEMHIANQVTDEYRLALARESTFRSLLQQEKGAVNAFEARAVKYRALKAAADGSTKLFFDLQQRIQDADVAAGLRSEDLRIISPARPADKPVYPRPFLIGALAFLLASVVGVGVILVLDMMDQTVSTPDQAELLFRVPVLAALPQAIGKNTTLLLDPRGYGMKPDGDGALQRSTHFHEAILTLHSALQFSAEGQLHTLAITSSIPGEGKSTVSANLAAAFAGLGVSTILVDADLRKPNAHRLFGLANNVGLTSILRGRTTLEAAAVRIGTNLTVLPAGPATLAPSETLLLGLPELLERLRSAYDLVLLDCPPVLGLADSSSVAKLSDGVLLVVHAGATDRQKIQATLRQLRGVAARVQGIILNKVSEQIHDYYGYYASAEDYHQARVETSDDIDD